MALLVALIPVSRSGESAALSAGPVRSVAVGSRTDSAQQAVDAVVTAEQPAQITSTASGIVTQVDLEPTAILHNGDPLLSVDGTPIVAYVAPSPLYRDLAIGAKGADVQAFGDYLTALKLIPAGSISKGVYTSAIAKGASALEARIGIPTDGQLHLSELAWVAPTSTTAGVVKVRVGDTVSAGSVLFEGASVPTAVSFHVTGSDQTRPTVPDGPLRLTAGSTHVDLASLALSPADRANLGSFFARAVGTGAVTATQSGGSTTYSGAILSTTTAPRVGVVPSSAVYQSTGGTSCVFSIANGNPKAVVLSSPKLLVGELGSVSVPASLAGQSVVRDPSALSSSVRDSCG